MHIDRTSAFAVALLALSASACGGGGSTPDTPAKGGADAGPVVKPPSKDAGPPIPIVLNPDASSGGGDANATSACAPNPANYDIPGNGCDDDNDGKVDNAPACDTGLALTGSAYDFAAALDLCNGGVPARTDGGDGRWGVISAVYTRSFSDNTKAPASGQWGIMPKYGSAVNPQAGASLGVLSSGYARNFDDATLTSCTLGSGIGTGTGSNKGCFKYGQNMEGTGLFGIGGNNPCDAPPGFPQNTSGCPDTSSEAVNDLIDVKLKIKVPANAQGFSVDLNFFSGEWPEYVCSTYNDSFITYLTSAAFNKGAAGNISFDSNKNPINVNSGFFNECTAGATLGCSGTAQSAPSVCSAGTGGLAGTGFAQTGSFCGTTVTAGGATGWLTSQAPVQPGEVMTIEFIIWDTSDANYDSSVMLDAFAWQPTPTEIVTHPTPNPQ